MIRLLYLKWHARQLRRAIDNIRGNLDEAPQEVRVKSWRINETPVSHNGEQPRRPVWSRAGKRVAPQ